jgi:SAM-dependent methyltransferase
MNAECRMTPDNFSEFSYSKRRHFRFFHEQGFDMELFGETPDPDNCDLKVYQDLLVFSFIRLHVPPKSRILEIGGGQSRVLRYFINEFECCNLDQLEGIGNGPTLVDIPGSRLVRDYIGNYNTELQDQYFDFVFSVSVFEHIPTDNPRMFEDIGGDIGRVLKPGGYSLHLLDSVYSPEKRFVWIHPFLRFIAATCNTMNAFIPPEQILADKDLFVLSETAYDRIWLPFTNQAYGDFGRPFSSAVLWRNDD